MFATLNAIFAKSLKCGEWAYLFVTIVTNEEILLDIADLHKQSEIIIFESLLTFFDVTVNF